MVEEIAEPNSSLVPHNQTEGSATFQGAVMTTSRKRFYVELKPDETTVVSWKKLLKEAKKASFSCDCEAPPGAHPALEARIAPEGGAGTLRSDPLPPPPNRFNSVIEKIERLYKGVHSSDEEEGLDDVQDEDKYDTSDSFIDDEELNEYFSVDNAATKYTGFFVNRGKLEKLNEMVSTPGLISKKRKRKDAKKLGSEIASIDPSKRVKSGVRMKSAARKASLSTVNDPYPSIDNAQLTMVKQTNQMDTVEGKEFKGQPVGSGIHKGSDSSICNSKGKCVVPMTNNEVTLDEGNNSDWQKRVTSGGLASEQLKTSGSERCKSNNLLKGLNQEKQTELLAGDSRKVKHVQKGTVDGNSTGTLRDGSRFNSATVNAKEASPGHQKITVLERAIQDLERGVADLCPPPVDSREYELNSELGGKSRHLPLDVKQKLAKVARLAQAKQGRISDDLVDRLMGILGHAIRVKTLKKNLKEMIETGLSALQEKEVRLQDMKSEVLGMVNSRVSSLLSQEGSSDDFQAMPNGGEKAVSSRYQWDEATEDRICDLYEQYIEGMDEHRGPQIRKLYAELAELWPEGWMDNIGIKHAIQRAKTRKKRQMKLDMEKSKRKLKDGQHLREDIFRVKNLPSVPNCLTCTVVQASASDQFCDEGIINNASNGRKHKIPSVKGSNCIGKKSTSELNPLHKKKWKQKLQNGDFDWQLISKKEVPSNLAERIMRA